MLFDPIKIRSLTLSSRLVFLPVGTNFGSREGFVTDKTIFYYVRRASDGVGMIIVEAARVLAYWGHHVILYEKANRIGGQVNLAVLPPWKQELNEIISYCTNALRELNVEIILNKEVTPEMVEENHPDAVLVATGSVPVVPDIPGINSPHVVFAEEGLNNQVEVGKNVVVIGGALVGCETVHFLADKGKRVTILRRGKKIGKEIGYTTRYLLLESLKKYGVQMLPGIQYEKIIENGIIIRVDGQSRLIKAENIVLAAGYLPNDALFRGLKGKVKEIYALGDCVEPRTILEAIHEASAIARTLSYLFWTVAQK